MWVKALPTDIPDMWEIVQPMIGASLPPNVRSNMESLTRVMESLIEGKSQLWMYHAVDEEGYRNLENLIGVMVTQIVVDQMTNTSNLLIFALYGTRTFGREVWTSGIEKLRQYCRSYGCELILAYSQNETVIKVVRDVLDGDVSWRLLKMEV